MNYVSRQVDNSKNVNVHFIPFLYMMIFPNIFFNKFFQTITVIKYKKSFRKFLSHCLDSSCHINIIHHAFMYFFKHFVAFLVVVSLFDIIPLIEWFFYFILVSDCSSKKGYRIPWSDNYLSFISTIRCKKMFIFLLMQIFKGILHKMLLEFKVRSLKTGVRCI